LQNDIDRRNQNTEKKKTAAMPQGLPVRDFTVLKPKVQQYHCSIEASY
jgi:hypothetical protein